MKVQVTVNIPEGYELACDEVRAPKKGEYYQNVFGELVCAESDHARYDVVVLKKAWQPEKGKFYKFWDTDSNDFVLRKFVCMDCGYHVDCNSKCWDNCAPINPEELGK